MRQVYTPVGGGRLGEKRVSLVVVFELLEGNSIKKVS
jgi:hypothetical protein